MLKEKIESKLNAFIEGKDLFLVDIKITPQQKIMVFMDGSLHVEMTSMCPLYENTGGYKTVTFPIFVSVCLPVVWYGTRSVAIARQPSPDTDATEVMVPTFLSPFCVSVNSRCSTK